MLRSYHCLDKCLHFTCRQKYYSVNIIGRFKHSEKGCQSPEEKQSTNCKTPEEESKNPNPSTKTQEELLSLQCKATVVVGGEDGIGYATAYEILSHRAKVVGIFGKNICKGMEACKALNCKFGQRRAAFYKVDVNCSSDLECAICKLTQEFGRIEAFVNAFGICDGKNWEHELNTNLIGMARSTIIAHQYLADSKKGGVIVNTAGIFGLISSAGCPTTAAAQYGIIGLSKSFGKESLFKHTNVRVVALCPGITESRLFRNANKRALTAFMGKCLKEEIEALKKQKPEVCGKSAVFLIRHADSGSVWFIEGAKLYKMECKLPHKYSEFYHQFAA